MNQKYQKFGLVLTGLSAHTCYKAAVSTLFRLTEHFGFKKSFAEQDLKKFLQSNQLFKIK